jgi:ABC-type Fe3+-hydroxamate transport system substrate-binding protein
MNNIESLKTQTVEFIKKAKSEGKTVCGYGASTKGNTLLQWFGLDNTLIDAIAERSPYKFGLKTIGTNIPILPEEEVRAMNPDYMLVLPWHFISEFVIRENEYLMNGGKFIVPCPKFEIIEK